MGLSTTYQALPLGPGKTRRLNPLNSVNFLSRWTFWWASPLITLGNKRQIDSDDLWPLQEENTSESVSSKFLPSYRKNNSIVRAFLGAFGWQVIFIGLMQLVVMACTLYGPLVLQQVVTSFEISNVDFQALFVSLIVLFVVKVAQAVIQTQMTLRNEMLFIKFSAALQDVLYRKTMVLNAASRRIKSTGEVSNLFTTDVLWILSVAYWAHQLWIGPLQIAVIMYLLWNILGSAMVSGLVVMFITLFANRFVASLLRNNWKVTMERKDARMKTVNEVFGSMQVIKLNAWEERYYEKIQCLRNLELKSLWSQFCLTALTITINGAGPILLTTASFAAYVLWLGETLTAAKVFTALSLFSLIKSPMNTFPQIIANTMQAYVSHGRIQEYLALDEKIADDVQTQVSSNDIAIEITNGTFGYDADKPLFSNVNLTIRHGEFVVLHGTVGEGKSSLCNALLGEIGKYNGT
ncbi:ATP-binding Cassette (ABC) Superfamily, partial [Thraustotheca clavata]